MNNFLTNYGKSIFLERFGIQDDNSSFLENIHFSAEKGIVDLYCKGHVIHNDEQIPLLVEPERMSNCQTIAWYYNKNGHKYPFITEKNGEIAIGLNLFNQIGQFLSGSLDTKIKNLDATIGSFVSYPYAEYYCRLIFDSIVHLQRERKQPLVCKSMWPSGKRYGVCLTHDIDEIKKTYQWITFPARFLYKLDFRRMKGQIRSGKEKIIGIEPFWTFPALMQLEKDMHVRSSLYFLNEQSQCKLFHPKSWRHHGRRYEFSNTKLQPVFEQLKMGGWDIGLHGSFDSYQERGKLAEEKRYLEQIIKNKVIGIRQHNLNLKIPETWIHQESAGLKYDTTLGFNNAVGFRCGYCYPFSPVDLKEEKILNIVEIPLIIEDLPYFRLKDRETTFSAILQKVIKVHGVLTLLWHHSVFNENEFPGWGMAYKNMIEQCLNHEGWVTSGSEIYEWIRKRNELKVDCTYRHDSLQIRVEPANVCNYIDIYLPQNMQIVQLHNARILRTEGNCYFFETSPYSNNDCVMVKYRENIQNEN